MLDLTSLTTEQANPLTANISAPFLATHSLLTLINDEDAKVASAVRRGIPVLAKVVDELSARVKNGGRVVYTGCGTSGRLGVLDASECLPTFNSEQFIGIIAGGDTALRRAKESVEDSPSSGAQDIQISLDPPLDPSLDSVIGISTSGRTPYVLGALQYARKLGCLTTAIVCTESSELSQATLEDDPSTKVVDHLICVSVGPEVVAGSTRMKAGTATKLVLNMISTGVMIKIGKTFGNLMVDLRVSNQKLRARAHNLIRKITSNPSLTETHLDTLLASCEGSVKLAILAEKSTLPISNARKLLNSSGGRLEVALETLSHVSLPPDRVKVDNKETKFFLCVDGGGTRTRAVISAMSSSGIPYILSKATSGPSNVSTLGFSTALTSISDAIAQAIRLLPPSQSPIELPKFEAIWIACAGIDPSTRPTLFSSFSSALSSTLSSTLSTSHIKLTSDTHLLSPLTSPGVAILSGTGSIGVLFSPEGKQTRRAGGLGYLLGDEGSGYSIGKEGIRQAITEPGVLRDKVLGALGLEDATELIDYVYYGRREELRNSPLSTQAALLPSEGEDAKSRIASLSKVILDSAFHSEDQQEPNPEAHRIIRNATSSLVDLVSSLLPKQHVEDNEVKAKTKMEFVCTGSVLRHFEFRTLVSDRLKQMGYINDDRSLRYIEEPSEEVALLMPSLGLV